MIRAVLDVGAIVGGFGLSGAIFYMGVAWRPAESEGSK